MALVSPRRTRQILTQYQFKSSRVLGQNFLVDANILRKIVQAADLEREDVVIEVGSGIGTLTEALAQKAKLVIGIECDRVLCSIAKKTLKDLPNVRLILADALKFDLARRLPDSPQPNKLVANLPYSIAVPLLVKYLEGYPQIKSYTALIQKEIAERLAASPGEKNYGIPSLKIQYYSQIKIIGPVSRRVFIPPPNVDSTIIRLERRSSPAVEVRRPDLMFKIIGAAFSQRRKTLRNTLKTLPFKRGEIEVVLQKAGIPLNWRGEVLSLADFARLSEACLDFLSNLD